MAIGNFPEKRFPPIDGKVTSVPVTTSASSAAHLSFVPDKEGAYMTFENCGTNPLHIVFGTSQGMDAPTATTNAGLVAAGTSVDWFISSDIKWFRVISVTGDTTLRYWRS